MVKDEVGNHNVDFEKLKLINAALSCSCQSDVTKGEICSHIVAAAKAKQQPLAQLLPEYDTVKGWNAQYAGNCNGPS